MTGLQVYQIMSAKLGEREADAFVTYVDTSFRDIRNELSTEIQRNRNELSDVIQRNRREMSDEIVRNRRELAEEIRRDFATKEDLANVKGELSARISDVESDVIRWLFAFFVTMLLAILGLYFKK